MVDPVSLDLLSTDINSILLISVGDRFNKPRFVTIPRQIYLRKFEDIKIYPINSICPKMRILLDVGFGDF